MTMCDSVSFLGLTLPDGRILTFTKVWFGSVFFVVRRMQDCCSSVFPNGLKVVLLPHHNKMVAEPLVEWYTVGSQTVWVIYKLLDN